MVEQFKKIDILFEAWFLQAWKASTGNKSAGRRSRKLSLEIGKAMMEWRKISMPKEKSE